MTNETPKEVPNIDRPIAQEAYDQLAEAYAARVDTKAHNAYFERPATLSLLPDVNGKHVLDAGCGPGVYSEWLIEHGAQVTAFDVNHKMVAAAKQRIGDRADIRVADMEKPFDFLLDEDFDLVISALALDYVLDWRKTFREFNRVLRPGGVFVYSNEHPVIKYIDHQEETNYFQTEKVEYVWRGFGPEVKVPSYRRPIGEMINPLIETGFILDHILEPVPIPKFKEVRPHDYDELHRIPNFVCFRAIKR